jgi:hypothetical protein
MTLFGIDSANPTTPHIPALKTAGVKFACRYIAPVGKSYDWKRLSSAEADALKAAGLGIVVVFESTANRALIGKAGGVSDATTAKLQAAACGMPTGRPIYFAVDFEATAAQEPAIHAYITGVASVLGHAATGVYGDYSVVKSAMDAGLCEYAWQTYGWSSGAWDPRVHLQQYKNGQTIGGLSVDYNHATAADYGQWYPPATRRLVGYTVSFIDAHGHRRSVDVKHPLTWLVRHPRVKQRGKVIITRRFATT